MLKAIRLLLSKKATHVDPKIEFEGTFAKPIEEYFMAELVICKYIKPELHKAVLKHLIHEKSLIKTGNTLTADEKRSLGLNTKLVVTRELVEVFTEDGLRRCNPRALLEEIYNRATITKNRVDGFEKCLRLGIKRFTLSSSGDGSECGWCKANTNSEFGQDILRLMQANCTCAPYSKCFIKPVVEF